MSLVYFVASKTDVAPLRPVRASRSNGPSGRRDGCLFWRLSERPVQTAVENSTRSCGPLRRAVQVSHAVPEFEFIVFGTDDRVVRTAAGTHYPFERAVRQKRIVFSRRPSRRPVRTGIRYALPVSTARSDGCQKKTLVSTARLDGVRTASAYRPLVQQVADFDSK